jgi:glycogen operon protein
MVTLRIARGRCLPLGASATPDGVNFSLLCRHGTAVFLVLYTLDAQKPIAEIALHPRRNRTGDHWHVLVAGLPPAFNYGWRVDGPPGDGNAFDPDQVLLDPSATAISDGARWGDVVETNPRFTTRRSVYLRRPFHWQEDVPLVTPMEDTIIYELHVRGFTCHDSSFVAHPGTFAGLTEKIPYLQALGVTAVELLPIHEFDECDCPFVNPMTGERLRNFWGYNSIAFAAPKSAYASTGPEHGQVTEFREMVRAFHAAGIEIYLDVVFNHTGEGDYRGRTYSFRGLDNKLYYMIGPDGRYLNFSGCGNTVSCNHPIVRQLLMNCLRYWVGDMHIDGLRFDLASVLGRDYQGRVLAEPPVVEMIAEEGVLTDTKLIAEPWDAAGLYQVGHFPYGRRWSEWNGKYRDDVRRFWKGEPGMAGAMATRLCGSSDLLLSQGVPMLLAGDEFLRTQQGNNNAWCQDNEISWVDWTFATKHADFLRFVREMIALRKRHPALRRRSFFRGTDVVWHGMEPGIPDWSFTSRIVALTLDGRQTGREPDRDFYLAFNAWRETLPFTIPTAPQGRPWRRAIDTALASPLDIVGLDEGPQVAEGSTYVVAPFSLVVLIGEA